MFLSSPADIVIYGGAAGGGKTYALLLEPMRNIHVKGFGAVIFRKTHPQIKNEGGLWDTSSDVYPYLEGIPRESYTEWLWLPHKNRVKFSHIQHDKDRHNWQGAQVPFIGFDELTHFSWKVFSYMLSRNRSLCGVNPYIRATCNPDPDHFLRKMLDWWIDNDNGLPIMERAGNVRWFVVMDDEIHWGDTKNELIKMFGPDTEPKTLTFIPSSVYDNKILLEKNPEYLANLKAMTKVDRERLLHGNWNVREVSGLFFQKDWFEVVDAAPAEGEVIRYWDRAATEKTPDNDPSWTAGVKMLKTRNNMFYVLDIVHFMGTPGRVKDTIKNVATQDGRECTVGIEQDPGQAGVAEANSHIRNLAGYKAIKNIVRENKATRAKPLSAQAEAGNVKIVRGKWNEGFFIEAENFDGTDKGHADRIDASSGAFYCLTQKKRAGEWGK